MPTSSSPAVPLRLGFVPGVTLTKWTTTWRERFRSVPLETVEVAESDQRAQLDAGVVDFCFVRLPIPAEGLHVIPLYEEAPVVWVSREHPIAAYEEVKLADLAGEDVLRVADAHSINQVALEVSVLLVPMSVARSHSRRDLTYRPVVDAPTTKIGLAWLAADPHPLAEEFIGVVRGRRPNSSRTQQERAARSERQPRPAPARRRRR